jgi:two-component system sensor histidine kinase YesM
MSTDIENKHDALQNNLIEITYMSEVQELCEKFPELSEGEVNRRLSQIRLNIAYKLSREIDATDVFLYLTDSTRVILYGDAAYPFSLNEEETARLLKEVTEASGHASIHAYTENEQRDGLRKQRDVKNNTSDCLVLARGVQSLHKENMLGVVAIRVNAKYFSRQIQSVDLGKDAQIVACDSGGNIVLSKNQDLNPINSVLQLPAEMSGNGISINMPIKDSEWMLIGLIPGKVLDVRAREIFINLLILIVPITAVVLAGVFVFSHFFIKPLTRLIHAINDVEAGNLSVEVKSGAPDEIGMAERSFNQMVKKFRALLEDVKAQEKHKRKLELAALQAQINPHFLSNTLNTARLLARTQQASNIEELLSDLINLMHISMNVHNTLIPIREEISCIKSYVDIMRHRNYASFDVIYEVQPELLDSMLPKLLLQPIVENAIKHGLNGKASGGQILIRVAERQGDILISVIDNGQGITPDHAKEILSRKATDSVSLSGIGLSNVIERIHLSFGESYGISIDSLCNVFTSVKIIIPNVKRGDNAGESIDC